ncbi:MAG: hypothetical protein ACHQFX_20640, partial [Chitinophagales bacterium]
MKNSFTLLILFLLAQQVIAQKDSVVSKEIVSLKYYNENASMQYLVLENKLKTGQKIEPLSNKTFQIFLDSIAASNLIAQVTTDNDGKAKSFIPPALKGSWEASAQHKFLAVAPGKENEAAAELEITKAKITIDTVSNGEARSIVAQVSKYENDEWVPASEVEMKVGIQRLGGILSAGDAETYTTDSSGAVTVELTRDSLPGDQEGNIVLAIKVEDNDQYGNLLVEKTVPWGIAEKSANNFFNQRSLWATKFRTPLWLLFMAYSIVIGVWGTIIYLVLQIIRIKKIG